MAFFNIYSFNKISKTQLFLNVPTLGQQFLILMIYLFVALKPLLPPLK